MSNHETEILGYIFIFGWALLMIGCYIAYRAGRDGWDAIIWSWRHKPRYQVGDRVIYEIRKLGVEDVECEISKVNLDKYYKKWKYNISIMPISNPLELPDMVEIDERSLRPGTNVMRNELIDEIL